MKILELRAEHVKKLKVVQINPEGNVIQLKGPNGSGKTSVLDSIWYALGGTDNFPKQPIREGEDSATIYLDLGDIRVTRKIWPNSTQLYVTGANGAKFPSPQKMLNELLGALTFDPLAFTREKPAQQLETLRGLVKVAVDVDALDKANDTDYNERRILGRDIDALKARAAAITVPEGLPATRIDTHELLQQLDEAGKRNADRQTLIGEQSQLRSRSVSQAQTAAAITREIAALEERLSALRGQAAEADQAALQLHDKAEAMTIPDAVDTSALAAAIQGAEGTNRAIEDRERRRAIEAELAEKTLAVEALTAKMTERETAKNRAIAEAEMPLPELGFGKGVVLYKGLPLDQASSAEQLRVSVSIAMAANPKLRIIRIQDGSLLDSKSMRLLAKMAEEHDYQVWIERVETDGKVGIVMEEGEVASVDGQPREGHAKAARKPRERVAG